MSEFTPCAECAKGRHDICNDVLPDGLRCTCWTCFRRWTD